MVSPVVEDYRPGYPRLAAFLNADNDFAIFRCFGRLHARILLHKQAEITRLEERLDELDRSELNAFNLRSSREDTSRDRHQIIQESERKILEYRESLVARPSNCMTSDQMNRCSSQFLLPKCRTIAGQESQCSEPE